MIRDTGYGAELPAQATSPEDAFESQERDRAEEIKTLERKLWVAVVPAAILMLQGQPHSDAGRWLALVITLPVIGWSGRHFYTRAWSRCDMAAPI